MAWKNILDVVSEGLADFTDTLTVGGGGISTPRIHLTATTDAAATTDNNTALIIGSRSGQHITIDTNEIMSKAGATSAGTLYLQDGGGAVSINGRQYGSNTTLWTGAWGMTSGQSLTLSQAITAQPHGTIIAWSWYNGTEACNWDWNYHFIPKRHVSSHSGNGIALPLVASGADYSCCKYVYVSDTKITGNDDNWSLTNTTHYVLRYVIGV